MNFKNCIIQEKVPIPRFIIYKAIVQFLKKQTKKSSFSTDTRNSPAKVQILLLWLPDFLIFWLSHKHTNQPTNSQNNIRWVYAHCRFLALNTMPSPFMVSALSQCSNYDMQFKPENYTCQHGKDSSYVMFGRKRCKHSSLAVVDAGQGGYMQWSWQWLCWAP